MRNTIRFSSKARWTSITACSGEQNLPFRDQLLQRIVGKGLDRSGI
jgi:hypothetical protein